MHQLNEGHWNEIFIDDELLFFEHDNILKLFVKQVSE
jgi:hypothetical protein